MSSLELWELADCPCGVPHSHRLWRCQRCGYAIHGVGTPPTHSGYPIHHAETPPSHSGRSCWRRARKSWHSERIRGRNRVACFPIGRRRWETEVWPRIASTTHPQPDSHMVGVFASSVAVSGLRWVRVDGGDSNHRYRP